MDLELDYFKTAINLAEYAASIGYKKVAQDSSKNSMVMCHPNSDKVIISRAQDQHWTYFSVRHPADNGSIIDFIQHRSAMSLGNLRQLLRPWVGEPCASIPISQKGKTSTAENRQRVSATYGKTRITHSSGYLERRGLSRATLCDLRFHDMIREDSRSNSVFPHYDHLGLCGYELKNYHFTGFASGGIKAVWHSRIRHSDRYLVITESAIDALSYHQIHPNFYTRYFSTAGALSPHQWSLIKSAVEKMPPDSIVVAAFDNDEQGNVYANELSRKLSAAKVERAVPKMGKDWNEQLKLSKSL